MWTENIRAITYGKRLAREIFLTQCVDLKYGVEPIERAWHLTQAIIEPAKKAIQEAKNHRAGIVMRTDESKLKPEKTAVTVVWKDKWLNSWREKRLYLGEKKQPHDAELWAISDALELPIKETRNTMPP